MSEKNSGGKTIYGGTKEKSGPPPTTKELNEGAAPKEG